MKKTYSLELPRDASGYIQFTTEVFDTSPAVFMAQARADMPPPVAGSTAEQAASEEKDLVISGWKRTG